MEELHRDEQIKWRNLHKRKTKQHCEYLESQTKRRENKPNTTEQDSVLNTTEQDSVLNTNSKLLPIKLADSIEPNNKIKQAKLLPSLVQHIRMPNISISVNPALLIGLVHLIINLFILFVLIYTFSYFLYFASRDVRHKLNTRRERATAHIREAEHAYVINRCDPTTRVPALEKQCAEWQAVMKNGLTGIKYTRIAVEVLADAADGFVSSFSWRSMLFIAVFMVLYLIFKK